MAPQESAGERARGALQAALRRWGVEILRTGELDKLAERGGLLSAPASSCTPADVERVLRQDSPRLLELRRRYRGHPAAASSVWSADYVEAELSMPQFRADNAYVWQARGSGAHALLHEVNYVLSAYYVKAVDRRDLLERFGDDDAFGNLIVEAGDGFAVSRELLDSTLEIDFLDRHLGLLDTPGARLLDIGAGYGRLAHRLIEAAPSLDRVYCADAIPESTFISEYYLDYRGVAQKARALPLDELAGAIEPGELQAALNIHSFSECPLAAIEWWLSFLVEKRVPKLMIVPNTGDELLTSEPDGRRLDFSPSLRAHGYERVALEPKYRLSRPVQRHGVYPTHYHLFERTG